METLYGHGAEDLTTTLPHPACACHPPQASTRLGPRVLSTCGGYAWATPRSCRGTGSRLDAACVRVFFMRAAPLHTAQGGHATEALSHRPCRHRPAHQGRGDEGVSGCRGRAWRGNERQTMPSRRSCRAQVPKGPYGGENEHNAEANFEQGCGHRPDQQPAHHCPDDRADPHRHDGLGEARRSR